jgi:hypothetical protein
MIVSLLPAVFILGFPGDLAALRETDLAFRIPPADHTVALIKEPATYESAWRLINRLKIEQHKSCHSRRFNRESGLKPYPR